MQSCGSTSSAMSAQNFFEAKAPTRSACQEKQNRKRVRNVPIKASDVVESACNSPGSKVESGKGGYKSGHHKQQKMRDAETIDSTMTFEGLQQGSWQRQQDATDMMLRRVESMRNAVREVSQTEPHEQVSKAKQLQDDLVALQAHLKACQQAAVGFVDVGTARNLGLPASMSPSVTFTKGANAMPASQDLGLPPSMTPSLRGHSKDRMVDHGLPSEMVRSVSNNNHVNKQAAGFFLEQLGKMTALVDKCQSDLNGISAGAKFSQPEISIPSYEKVNATNEPAQEIEQLPEDPQQTSPTDDLETVNLPKDDSDFAIAAKDDSETLRIHLQELEVADPQCVLSVRKINRLGFDSRALLERHFAWYGVPSQILVAHLRVKSSGRRPARTRPAGLGFVVMATEADAERVLALGEKQLIGDVEILVSRFQRLTAG